MLPDLSVELQSADCSVGGEGPTNRYDAKAAQARQIERRVDPVRLERREGQPDGPPLVRRNELGAVGLPGSNDIGSAQVQVIALAVAEDVDLDSRPWTGIDGVSTWREV
jgi:hypothetical protein